MDFENIEKEAQDHSKQVDEGIDKTEQEADKQEGDKDHGLIDKAGGELEKEI